MEGSIWADLELIGIPWEDMGKTWDRQGRSWENQRGFTPVDDSAKGFQKRKQWGWGNGHLRRGKGGAKPSQNFHRQPGYRHVLMIANDS